MPNISTEFKQKTQLLEKHLRDRTLQPISEFKKVGEKEAGYIRASSRARVWQQ